MSAIEYQSFGDFYDTVEPLVAPEDLGAELTPFFRDQIGNALADIQTIVHGFRTFNVEMFDKGGADEFCNASILCGPPGKITQVFAFKPGLECRKFHYTRTSTAALDCWLERQRCLCPAGDPPDEFIYTSPYCNYVVAGEAACALPYLSGEEDDCRFKNLSAADRIFAVGPDHKIYAAPRFPCGYLLVVQWQGIRRKWSDTNLVPVDQQLREAVVNYVEHKMAVKERNSTSASEYFDLYTMNLRMLKYRWSQDMDTSPSRDCESGIETLMGAFHPLYATSFFSSSSSSGAQEVFIDRSPLPPDDPTKPALSFPAGGGSLEQWSPSTQSWN